MWASQQSLISKARENLQAKDAKHMAKKSEENDGDITTSPVDSYVLAEPLSYFTIRKEPNKLKLKTSGKHFSTKLKEFFFLERSNSNVFVQLYEMMNFISKIKKI